MQYYIIPTNATVTTEIKKSKFISFVFYVQTVDEIKKHLEELNNKYSDATHICYAYVVNDNGIKEKAVDNGEPAGTAGKPILDCIKKQNFVNMLVAVVRYFGGIKLGAGGLVRAYSQSAKTVIESCKQHTQKYMQFEEKTITLTYAKSKEFVRFCEQNNCKIVETIFDVNVVCKVQFEKGRELNFDSFQNPSK